MFQTPFHFNLPTGSETFPTWEGFAFTVLLVIVLTVYGIVQMMTLLNYNNSIITVNEIDSHYNQNYTFDLDIHKNLQVAFGITYYDGNTERLDFDDIGRIIPRIKTWNLDTRTQFRDLKFRPCSREELGISEEYSEKEALFYPPHPKSVFSIEFYWKKLNCIDEPFDITGDYESDVASHL